MLVHSESELLSLASDAVAHARRLGAPAATVSTSEFAGASIKVRQGAAETAVREGGQSLGITIFDGGRAGSASTEALDKATIERTVEHALAITRHVEADTGVGLADPEWLAQGEDVPLFAPSDDRIDRLLTHALDIEREALDCAGRASTPVRLEECGASSHEMRWARVTSDGFARAATASMNHRSCVAIAFDGDEMMRDWSWEQDRQPSRLPSHAEIARKAVEGALGRIGARSIATRTAPVLYDNHMAASLVNELVGGLSGHAQYHGSTFLHEALGSPRLAEHVDLVEDPFEPYGMASRGWDSEGVAGKCRHIVKDGIVAGYFLGSRFARKLSMRSTGNADGPANLTLTSRISTVADDFAAMLRKLDRGLLVTGLMGGGANPATGSYSRAAEGFWVEGGEIAYPVRDITIAGNLPEMLKNIAAVGNDARRTGSVRTGSLLVPDMRIAS